MLLGTVKKQPVEVLDYDFDYTEFLDGIDTLDSATTAVSPTGGLTVTGSIVGDRVKVWASGGTDGSTYVVTVTATTVDGRVKQDELRVRIKEV